MKRIKRWSLLLVSLLAVGVITSPAAASAHYGLETSHGKLQPGKTWQLKGGFTFSNGQFLNNCRIAEFELYLYDNTEGTAFPYSQSTSTMNTYAKKCETKFGEPFSIKDLEIKHLRQTGLNHAVSSLAFVWEYTPGGPVCTYSTENAAWDFVPGSAEIALSPSSLSVQPAACRVGWSIRSNGNFTASSFSLGPVIIW